MRKKIAYAALGTFALLLALHGQEGDLDRLPLGRSPQKTQLAALAAEKIMLTEGGREADLPALVERALKSDVIVIGEYHDNFACHQFQADFIAALFQKTPRLVVGFEFFERSHDEILEAYRAGKIGAEELLARTGWYKRSALNFGYTRLIADVLHKNGIKAIGLNVPRDLIRKVSQQGFAALSADEKKLFPGWETPNPDHEFYIRQTFGPVAVQLGQWFAAVYGAQKCWDVIMAESMRLCLARPEMRGYKGVIIAGAGHVAYGLGIPFRYSGRDKKARLLTIVPVYAGKKAEAGAEENPMLKMLAANLKPAAVFSRGIADAVLALAREARPFYPVWGFSGRMTAEGYELADVAKDGLAEKWGLRQGDLILAVEGRKFSSEEELRAILAKKGWDDAASLDLRRKAMIKN